jgi:hypothetical protein
LTAENAICPIPLLPEAIKEAVNNDKLAVFIGAGVSRIIGCIGWEQLGKDLVNRCFSTHNLHPCISFREKETLLSITDHKKLITICHHILKTNNHESVFFEELERSLEADPKLVKTYDVYNELYGLHGLFVTTNMDRHFDSKFIPSRIVYRVEDFDPSHIDRTKLYHIHGSIADRDSLVLTVRQYIQRYNEPRLVEFIRRIFEGYVVLFVGYGVNEFELLDLLIQKHDPNEGKELKHFTLRGFYRGEDRILEYEQAYYTDMGIQVLPFEKDAKGYNQIYEVIRSWNREINATSTYLYDTYKQIDDVIDSYDKTKAQSILQIVKNDKSQENYFFRKLASSSTPSLWLNDLNIMGYFDPRHNPSPINAPDKKSFRVSTWKILPYLENLAVRNAEVPCDKTTDTILDIVNSVIDFTGSDGKRVENSYTDCGIIRIVSKLPLHVVTDKHIKFVGVSMKSRYAIGIVDSEIGKSLLPRLLDGHSKDLLLVLLSVMFQYKKEPQGKLTQYTSVMDEYWLSETLKRYKPKIAELFGIEASDQVLNTVRAITNADPFQFNIGKIPTIEDIGQRYHDEYQYELVSFVRDMYQLIEASPLEDRLKNLLNEKHEVFRRIALYTINYRYKQFNHIIWSLKENPLDDRYANHELYELLKSNCRNFSETEIDKILTWIECATYGIRTEMGDHESQKQLAYKKEWLYALLDSHNEKVRTLYEKYNRINPTDLDHPGSLFWMEPFRFAPSPSTRDATFHEKSNQDVADYLRKSFKDKSPNELSIEQISDDFQGAVCDNPEKFSVDMQPFLEVPIAFQYALLRGLSEAWSSNRIFPWNCVLDFMHEIVKSDSFRREQQGDELFANPNWIASEIASMIENGTRDDNHCFEEELIPKAEKILLVLAEKSRSTARDGDQIINSVLNSAKGKTFSAMVQLSLRAARASKVPTGSRWIRSIKEDFTSRLDRTFERSLDFSVILGQYFPNLIYLDEEWVKTNIERIFPKEDTSFWRATFSGYLFYAASVYGAAYLLLKQNDHYSKALRTDFPDRQVAERLVQHICIGYFRGFESLEDKSSLISKLISDGTLPQLSEIVGYFWMLRSNLTDQMRGQIKPIWKRLYQVLAPRKDDPGCREVIANMARWLSLIERIDDETIEWLLLSAQCFRGDYETAFFVEYLSQHVSKTPKEVGRILLQMLQSGTYPQYKVEHIQETVRTLYLYDRDNADRICNLYGARGIDFLRTIYDEHRRTT